MASLSSGHFGGTALDRAVAGHRLSREELLALYQLPLCEVAAAAHEVRLHQADPEVVTYSIGGNIDYTNVCVVACKFCNFYRTKHQEGAYTLSSDEMAGKMQELRQIGSRELLLQGGVNPELPFDWYLGLLRFLKAGYPEVHIDAFSPEEILGLEKITGREASALLAELKGAGLDGLPGAAAEILVDEVRRQIARTRIMTKDWFRIIDAAEQLGLQISWVGMVFGFGESPAQRVEHLLALRAQQDRALKRYRKGFVAFKVWPARLEHTRLKYNVSKATADEIAQEYLRELAISRLALDNISNHRAVWRTMGFSVARAALCSGANDLCGTGSINAIDATMREAGKPLPDLTRTLIKEIMQCISDAGFVPAQRDAYYNILVRHGPNLSPADVSAVL